jgi:hypothetical protein
MAKVTLKKSGTKIKKGSDILKTTKKKQATMKDSTLASRVEDRVSSTAALVAECERLVKASLVDLSASVHGEDMDIEKFKILVTLEAPKNTNGNSKKDRDNLGHFTVTDQWWDAEGIGHRAININPFRLKDMSGPALFEVAYHEAVHAFCSYLGYDGKTKDDNGKKKPSDCSANGRHTKTFKEFGEVRGILDVYKIAGYVGHASRLTEKGEKMAAKLKAKAPSYYKVLPEAKPKNPKKKRVTLTCMSCDTKVGMPVGVYMEQLKRMGASALEDTSVLECLPCKNGMLPPDSFEV